MAEDQAEAQRLLNQALAILYRLREGSRLSPTQEAWIGQLKERLQGTSGPEA